MQNKMAFSGIPEGNQSIQSVVESKMNLGLWTTTTTNKSLQHQVA